MNQWEEQDLLRQGWVRAGQGWKEGQEDQRATPPVCTVNSNCVVQKPQEKPAFTKT